VQQLAVVGEEQQAAGLLIQAPDRTQEGAAAAVPEEAWRWGTGNGTAPAGGTGARESPRQFCNEDTTTKGLLHPMSSAPPALAGATQMCLQAQSNTH
jgi:hypothetical protein